MLMFKRFLKTSTSYILNPVKIYKLKDKRDLQIVFGSGSVKIPGWINSDLPNLKGEYSGYPDIYLDITKTFPINSNSAAFLYCEHVIEHINIEQAQSFLSESFRILKKGGVLRIATPDMSYLTEKYLNKDWQKQDWLSWPEYRFIKTPAEMLNIAFRWWGHKYLYDEKELRRRLKEAGFVNISKKNWRKSSYRQLNNLETRADSKLIMEGVK